MKSLRFLKQKFEKVLDVSSCTKYIGGCYRWLSTSATKWSSHFYKIILEMVLKTFEDLSSATCNPSSSELLKLQKINSEHNCSSNGEASYNLSEQRCTLCISLHETISDRKCYRQWEDAQDVGIKYYKNQNHIAASHMQIRWKHGSATAYIGYTGHQLT